MAYRSIIVNLDIDGPAVHLIKAATDLALRFNARLIGLSSADVPPPVTAANGAALDGDSARLQCEDIDRRLATLREGFIDLVGKEVEAGWCSGIGNPTRFLVDAARSADLIVTASPLKPYFGCTYRRVDLGGLVLDAGRPVLVCVNEVKRVLARTVMVAWKDTREARRAVADAIPLLSLAREVVIVTVEPETDSRAKEGITDVAAFLAHHGIKARTEVVAAKDESEQLYKVARSLHADTIVSGAYGHSRMREWIFGGVTRSLLEDNGLNRFMSN